MRQKASTSEKGKAFPTYNKSAADDFENILAKSWEISIFKGTCTVNENS